MGIGDNTPWPDEPLDVDLDEPLTFTTRRHAPSSARLSTDILSARQQNLASDLTMTLWVRATAAIAGLDAALAVHRAKDDPVVDLWLNASEVIEAVAIARNDDFPGTAEQIALTFRDALPSPTDLSRDPESARYAQRGYSAWRAVKSLRSITPRLTIDGIGDLDGRRRLVETGVEAPSKDRLTQWLELWLELRKKTPALLAVAAARYHWSRLVLFDNGNDTLGDLLTSIMLAEAVLTDGVILFASRELARAHHPFSQDSAVDLCLEAFATAAENGLKRLVNLRMALQMAEWKIGRRNVGNGLLKAWTYCAALPACDAGMVAAHEARRTLIELERLGLVEELTRRTRYRVWRAVGIVNGAI